MHCRAIICSGILLLLAVAFVSAENLDPHSPNIISRSGKFLPLDHDHIDAPALLELSITALLDGMSPDERSNSSISISLSSSASAEACELSRKIMTAWNNGNHAGAIDLMAALEGIATKEPSKLPMANSHTDRR